jgi:hypothetical protein
VKSLDKPALDETEAQGLPFPQNAERLIEFHSSLPERDINLKAV